MIHAFDAAVIGAGIAGLTAARALAEAGKRTVVVEASDRPGGRIWTVMSPVGSLPVELGAEFVHGTPHPTLDLAREAGVELLPVANRHFGKRGHTFHELDDPWQELASVLERLEEHGPDLSAAAFFERHAVAPDRRERLRHLIEGFEAAPLSEVSIRSLAVDSDSLSNDDHQFRVAGGYGRLVDFTLRKAISAGAELRLGNAVNAVHWRPNGPTTLRLAGSDVQARMCIVAVGLGVLQAEPALGGLAFEPSVDPWAAALPRLGMGHACRITLQFARELLTSSAPPNAFIHCPTSSFETFWSSESGTSQYWTVWSGGPKAHELSRKSKGQRGKLALEALSALLEVPEQTLLLALEAPLQHHDFSNDEHARGSYSFCRPDGGDAAESLRTVIGRTLLMAGEATDQDYPGTVAGAIASGKRAAKQALEVLAEKAL